MTRPVCDRTDGPHENTRQRGSVCACRVWRKRGRCARSAREGSGSSSGGGDAVKVDRRAPPTRAEREARRGRDKPFAILAVHRRWKSTFWPGGRKEGHEREREREITVKGEEREREGERERRPHVV